MIWLNVFTGTSHCADMYSNKNSDPPQLIAARAKIGQIVDKWIHEAKYKSMSIPSITFLSIIWDVNIPHSILKYL